MALRLTISGAPQITVKLGLCAHLCAVLCAYFLAGGVLLPGKLGNFITRGTRA